MASRFRYRLAVARYVQELSVNEQVNKCTKPCAERFSRALPNNMHRRTVSRNRKHQLGFSSLEIIFYTCIVFAGYGLVAAVVVGSSYLMVKRSPFALIPVVFFWLWTWSYTSFWGIGPQKWAMKIAVPACEEEIKSLPKRVEVDGVMDEGAFLTWQNVTNLLVLRGLGFVEVRVRSDSGGRTHYLHTSETSLNRLLEEGKVVRFDLGKQGDSSCIQKVESSQFKPDTCIRMNLLDESKARYSVRHSFDNSAIPFAVGNWVLSDNTLNTEIVRISTHDSPTRAQLGNPSTIQKVETLKNCRGPHALLFSTLYGVTRGPEHANN
ncbi:hypothetical protein SAMN05216303_1143 [Rhodoferax sp. OV413]|nr:hypothetical protein SAMN05216303_1143 [Rhodoferax sp. OV413]